MSAERVRSLGSRERLLTELRQRGARGGVIQPHRAMAHARFTTGRLVGMLLVPLALSAATVVALPLLARLWTWLFELARGPLGIPGEVAHHAVRIPPFLTVDFPYVTASAGIPSPTQWSIVGIICATALLISVLLPSRWTPVAYALRLGTFVQLTAVVAFALPGFAFPYVLSAYLLGFLQMGSILLVLAPLVLGMVFFPFDIAMSRKIALTAMVVAHAAVLLPLQILLHAYLIFHLSLLVMPTMFFVFGLLVEIFAFVAFYGWGMSWRSAR